MSDTFGSSAEFEASTDEEEDEGAREAAAANEALKRIEALRLQKLMDSADQTQLEQQ